MPTDTFKSLRKKNDKLQAQLEVLQNEYKNLESSLADREVQAASESNGGSHDNDDIDNESVKCLEFLSAEYDSLSAFRKEAKEQLQGLTKKLNSLVEQVGEIAEAIDAIDRYSYQYNVKIVGIPKVNSPETALDTSTLCVKLSTEVSLSQAAEYDHLTPKTQRLLIDAKKFQEEHRYSFCWVKNCSIFLRKSATSRPVKIKNHTELQRLAEPTSSR